MPQKSGAGVLIVCGIAADAGSGQNSGKGAVQHFHLKQAVRAGQNSVRPFGIQATDQFAVFRCKAGDGFVSVMPGFLHAKHRLNRSKLPQKLLQPALFAGQLFRIGNAQHRAAAAAANG